MTRHQNLHTHTKYSDGTLPPAKMVEAALEARCGSIGFSEHSYVPFDLKFSIKLNKIKKYIKEVNKLKVKYKGSIEVYLGLEQDYYSDVKTEGLDFIIGALHYVMRDGRHVSVDAGAKNQRQMVEDLFGGDYYAFAEDYYSVMSKIVGKTNADIIGHFDLIAKYNSGKKLFDEEHPRYRKAALGAMEEILESCKLFEVNTGAMYRLGNTEPYPSIFLLKELSRRGGEVLLSSDSHDAGSLCHKFDETKDLLKACGFKHIKHLTENGFTNVEI